MNTKWRKAFKEKQKLENKKAFIKHVQNSHQGITLPETYVNQPPWVDWIFFYSDEAEIFYNDVEVDWLSKG